MKLDQAVYYGKPEDASGRMPKEMEVYRFLDGLGIAYARVDHEAVPTVEACAEIERLLEVPVCKNLFLCNRKKTEFYLLLLPGEKSFRAGELARELGCARLSFADASFMEKFLGLMPGSVSILGLMNDKEKRVRLLIDREILQQKYIGCHPCVNTSSLRLEMKDILERFLPAVDHPYTAVG